MRHCYHTEQWLPCLVEQVFLFFANPDNLPLLMPSWQKARIDTATILHPPQLPDATGAAPIRAAGVGSQISLSFRPFPFAPFRIRWDAEISEYAWYEHFCDRQLTGPFAFWNHCHYVRRVVQAGVEGTLISDDVEYELPLGFAGELAHRLMLRRQIERTFAFRQSQVARLLAHLTSPSRPQPVSRA